MTRALPVALLVLASACNREEKPQAPTPAETSRLDDAEDMLNGMNLTAPDDEDSSGVDLENSH
nr:hypothetical protein [uncultured Sphingomonas sp.]